MNANGKKVTLIMAAVGLIFLCVFLSSCSKIGKIDGPNWGKGEGETVNKQQYLQEDKIHALNETAPLKLPTNQNPNRIAAEYTIKTAKLFDEPEEAEIDRKYILMDGDVHYDIKTGIPAALEENKSSFLLCDVAVENINSEFMNITELSLVYLTPEEKELKLVGLPAYFSESIREGDSKDYYDFEIPAGQSKDMKVGWWVDLEECKKENMYLMLNYRGDETLQQYWKLNL